jgi:DNA-directed RNA polymerase specialized sigma24 family protein
LDLSRDEVRVICEAYPLLKIRVRDYDLRRDTVISRAGGSSVTVSKKQKSAGDPTADKVVALEQLEQQYLGALLLTRTIEGVLQFQGPEGRRMFELYFCRGLSQEDVAEKVRFSVRTVSRRLNKILDTLSYWLAREPVVLEAARELLKVS